ncbi:MAG: hypothetical protein RML36_15685 [Anaerolineae bacterium]|nr:hypothetical protein [Anaerolineae bacterium]
MTSAFYLACLVRQRHLHLNIRKLLVKLRALLAQEEPSMLGFDDVEKPNGLLTLS